MVCLILVDTTISQIETVLILNLGKIESETGCVFQINLKIPKNNGKNGIKYFHDQKS